jgi:hypothetical protein
LAEDYIIMHHSKASPKAGPLTMQMNHHLSNEAFTGKGCSRASATSAIQGAKTQGGYQLFLTKI